MVHQTFACIRALLYGWIGWAVLQTAGSWVFSPPFDASLPSGRVPIFTPSASFETLLNQNIFLPGCGLKQSLAASAKETGEWILRGTFVGGSHSRAVVEEKESGRQKWVGVGDFLGDLRVVSVEREGVKLQGARGEIKLAFVREGMPEVKFWAEEPVAVAKSEPQSEVQQVGQDEFLVRKSVLLTLAQQLPELLDSLGLILFEEKSGPAGYLIAEDVGMPTLRPIGIRDGDLIRKINGKPLESDQDLLRAFGVLAQQKEVQIEIDRDEEIRVLTYHVEP